MNSRFAFGAPPVVDKDLERRILSVLRSGQWSPGYQCRMFEMELAKAHGHEYGVMVNSGTDALVIALKALKEANGWPDGSEVLVPSVTFVATYNAVFEANLVPVPVDISLWDYGMDPELMEARVSGITKAVLVANLFGLPAQLKKISQVAKRHGLKLLEDSCETMFVDPVGRYSDITCFSTYMAHVIVTGVGGMAITKNRSLERLMRSYANHGRSLRYIPGYNVNDLSQAFLKSRFRFDRIGHSCRPTEFEAAMGRWQLKQARTIVEARQRNASYLSGRLKDEGLMRHFVQPMLDPKRPSCWMMYPLVLKTDVSKWDLCLHLEKAGIETREMMPVLDQPCYKGRWDIMQYPIAWKVGKDGFYVSCHQNLSSKDLDHIVKTIKKFFRRFV